MSSLSKQIEELEAELLSARNSKEYWYSEYQKYESLYTDLQATMSTDLARVLSNCSLNQQLEIEDFLQKLLNK